ncbi:MAG: methanogenic corrinoid protein MtbC1 [Planctomycetota bacterium]|jgi:methanogenic corrinoid protein MtbC1
MNRLHVQSRETLFHRRHELARQLIARIQESQSNTGRGIQTVTEERIQSIEQHFLELGESMFHSASTSFLEHVLWSESVHLAHSVGELELSEELQAMKSIIIDVLPEEAVPVALEILHGALGKLGKDGASSTRGFIEEQGDEKHQEYLDSLLRGDRKGASRLVTKALDSGMDIRTIYIDVFQRSQHVLGDLWMHNKISVAQEHFCTAATQQIISSLYEYTFGAEHNGRIFVGACVGSELHELGIRMVCDFLQMEGWDTRYLGANTPAQAIVEEVARSGAEVLGISATMTYHLRQVSEIIAAVRGCDETSQTRIVLGGYPFLQDPQLYAELGADGYAKGAREAVTLLDPERKGDPSSP